MIFVLLGLVVFLSVVVLPARAELVFGVIPLEDKVVYEQKFAPLTAYLKEKLGESVTLLVGDSYEQIESGIAKGDIHLALLGPVGAVKVNSENPRVFPVVKVVESGSPFYKSYIIAPKDSPLASPADLKGRVFAFGDQGSTSSCLVPRYILAKNGVQLADLADHLFTGSHDNVVRAVLEGKAAAGGVKESTALKHQSELKFLEISKPIPNFPICVNIAAVGKDKARQIQQILLAIPEKDTVITAIDKKFERFDRSNISDYAIIKAIMSQP